MNKQPYRPNNGHSIKMKIIVPDAPIRIQDLKKQDLNELLKADLYEGRTKLGRFKITDIKRKFL